MSKRRKKGQRGKTRRAPIPPIQELTDRVFKGGRSDSGNPAVDEAVEAKKREAVEEQLVALAEDGVVEASGPVGDPETRWRATARTMRERERFGEDAARTGLTPATLLAGFEEHFGALTVADAELGLEPHEAGRATELVRKYLGDPQAEAFAGMTVEQQRRIMQETQELALERRSYHDQQLERATRARRAIEIMMTGVPRRDERLMLAALHEETWEAS